MIASGAGLLLAVGWASPASAHTSGALLYRNGRLVGEGGVQADHTHAYACDRYADGNVIFTEYNRSSGAAVYDYNGASAGCGTASINYCVVEYRVCTNVGDVKYCSPWVPS